MSHLARLVRTLAVGTVAVVATLSMNQVAAAEAAAPTVPDLIKVPAGNKVFLVGHAEGVQIYRCNGTSWSFVAPRAKLFGDNGKLLTTHSAGPTWQAVDGSAVKGSVAKDGTAKVVVEPSAIPWLLLDATPLAGDSKGDRLASTTFIQRVATKGGLAPTTGCDATTADTVNEVPYTADYYFWKADA